MKTPHRCPVCNGNGLVPNGFYSQTSGHWTTSSVTPEQCRSCSGTGVLWSSDDEIKVEYKSQIRYGRNKEIMKTLGGAIFCYNAVKHDYHIVESVLNLKDFCDQVVVLDAGSDDGTVKLIQPLADDKCEIICINDWDNHHGSFKLSYFANLAMDMLDTDYIYHAQADEIVHESSFPWIRKAMEEGEEGYMCRRYNLWKDPYHMLNVEQARKPCSTEIVRLAKKQYRAVDDAESLGVPRVFINYLDKIEVFHMGFVRKREVMKSKIIHMQKDVFQMADYDRKLDLHEQFEPMDYFNPSDIIPIVKPLPKVIQEWAAARMPK